MTIHQQLHGAAISMQRILHGWNIKIQTGLHTSLWTASGKEEPGEADLVVLVARHRAQISAWVN